MSLLLSVKDIATGKKLMKHSEVMRQTECHKESIERVVTLTETTSDIGESLSSSYANEIDQNKNMLLKIFENIRFLARQELPLRGDGDESNSNFVQLFKLRSADDSSMLEWLQKRTNKYTSKDIQNEILNVLAAEVLEKISNDLQTAGFFSIMVDELTDSSNQEQVTLVLRWVDKMLSAHEEFIGLYLVEDIKSDTIVAVIKDILLRLNLGLSRCRGQCYDVASNMTGKKNGVATQILKLEERALFTHCYGHSLNLAANDALKVVPVMKDAFDMTYEICKLIKFSPRREAMFDKLKSDTAPGTPGIRVLCPTR